MYISANDMIIISKDSFYGHFYSIQFQKNVFAATKPADALGTPLQMIEWGDLCDFCGIHRNKNLPYKHFGDKVDSFGLFGLVVILCTVLL